ncbi:MAG: hypothetical protein RLZZ188_2720, partial [Verrucomicrobiota bacterium]
SNGYGKTLKAIPGFDDFVVLARRDAEARNPGNFRVRHR